MSESLWATNGWAMTTGSGTLVLHNVLVPQFGFFANETGHQSNAVGVIGNDHLDPALAQDLRVAGKIGGLADDDPRDAELDDGAGAHHARRQRRVEGHAPIGFLPSSLAQAVHLAVRDWVTLLDALVAPLGNQAIALGEHAADRAAALLEAGLGFRVGHTQEFGIRAAEFDHVHLPCAGILPPSRGRVEFRAMRPAKQQGGTKRGAAGVAPPALPQRRQTTSSLARGHSNASVGSDPFTLPPGSASS